jgi:hypothetical protein
MLFKVINIVGSYSLSCNVLYARDPRERVYTVNSAAENTRQDTTNQQRIRIATQ